MKILKRLLLIHWHYFSHELIEFDKVNFLTGKNSSGKSTIIDAMQLVLLGDTSGSFFNKAASGKGNRTLAGYLMCELGDDESSGFRYLRQAPFSSYIVLEFYDKTREKLFPPAAVLIFMAKAIFPGNFFALTGRYRNMNSWSKMYL
jgi:uncharacterized protein YPO0396